MRITADIIDDDTYVFEQTLEKGVQVQILVAESASAEYENFEISPVLDFHNAQEIGQLEEKKSDKNMNHQSQKVHEMTQQFKNLHVSDVLSPSCVRSNFTLSEMASSNSKPMEKAEGDIPNCPSELDAVPAWLTQYLSKMKQEIKKEVVEELSCLPQIEMLGSQPVTPCKLDENQLQFQGEVVHYGIFCDNCDQLIHGIRYKCGNCSDFDLCQECESLPNIHNRNHIFLKIRYPVALKFQKQKRQQLLSSGAGELYAVSSKSHQPKKLYEAKFVCDDTVPDGTVLAPSTRFVKSWRVMNSGKRVWTHATKLQHIQGSAGLTPASEIVDVPHLRPGEEGIVSVLFTTPASPGVYRSHWNFCHKSRPFGQFVWCHIVVKSPEYEEKKIEAVPFIDKMPMPIIIDVRSVNDADIQRKEVASITQVLTAVKEEHERGNIVPRKLAVSSHTATPNNTPFDLTPPKSPDHNETTVKKIQELIADVTSSCKHSNDSDNEDVCSVVSLGSSESDTEFVVIPMPKCFNLSESFVSHRLPHLAHYLHSEADGNIKKSQEQVKLMQDARVSQAIAKRSACSTETVSQETGVPELSEHVQEQTVLEIMENIKDEKKILLSHILTDGSSSEISIIESEENSPTEENALSTIESISIAVTNETNPTPDVVCELKYPVPEVFKDDAQVKDNVSSTDAVENEDQASDIPCNATFPKFPVEGINSMYESSSGSHEERTIQVLPEGLVTGALSAAASVYNTARAVISTIQQPRNERGTCLSQDPPEGVGIQNEVPVPGNPHTSNMNPMDQLAEMGFCNRQQNEHLLQKHNGDVALVVAELVNLSDNDWYASRHIPAPPTYFD